MRVFVSYAREDEAIASRVKFHVNSDPLYTVFTSLPAGGFHHRIREEIRRARCFVFLISPHSIRPRKFTLSELAYAKKCYDRLSERLLPVMIKKTALARVPEPLRSLNILIPRGNLETEILMGIEAITRTCERPEQLVEDLAEILPRYVRASEQLYSSILLNAVLAAEGDAAAEETIQRSIDEYNPLWEAMDDRSEVLGVHAQRFFGRKVTATFDAIVGDLKRTHLRRTLRLGMDAIQAANKLMRKRTPARVRLALAGRLKRALDRLRRVEDRELPALRASVERFLRALRTSPARRDATG